MQLLGVGRSRRRRVEDSRSAEEDCGNRKWLMSSLHEEESHPLTAEREHLSVAPSAQCSSIDHTKLKSQSSFS